jgi:prolipoprotein diacylglyceryltransferase
MSFHGGALGVIVAIILFCRQQRLDILAFGDRVCAVVPIGLFLGRLANFINGELWGRVTDVPWGMVFPTGGPEPRHPSQLYQAGMEGLVLFVVLQVLVQMPGIRARRGFVAGAFLAGYGVARAIGELFRQPDAHLGFLFAGATMGQLLSVPMVLVGGWLMLRSRPVTAGGSGREGPSLPEPLSPFSRSLGAWWLSGWTISWRGRRRPIMPGGIRSGGVAISPRRRKSPRPLANASGSGPP